MAEGRRRRWPIRVVAVALVLAAAFFGGGGWYFSDLIDERGLDGASRRASTAFDPETEVVAIAGGDVAAGGSITLAVADDPGALLTDGVWGLRWDAGYGQVAGILERDGDTVTRAFLVIDGEPPEAGDPAELDPRAYPEPAAGERDVIVEGPLGDYPAWYLPGRGDTWAIVVHGNAMVRSDGIRLGPILAERSLPALWITYRNDVGAPEDPSGKLRYGLTEWADLEAAVRHALDQGAEDVVLLGYSMGGAVIMRFLQRSDLAGRVRGVVLDAPMLDFSETVDDNASRETLPLVGLPLPSSLTWVAKWLAERRFGVRWDQLDYLADTSAYAGLPFLVFHGTEDATVPIATSRELAELLPDQVTLVECPEADHIECWNVDAAAYADEVLAFLERVGA